MKLTRLLYFVLMSVALLIFFWIIPLKLIARIAKRFGHSSPCPAGLSWLVDNPIRQWYMRPVLGRIGIQAGERVLELGPGAGAFTIGAARDAGQQGKLICVDIQPEMIAMVEEKVQAAGVTNVETHVASAYELPLEDNSVDRAFLITVLPEIPDEARALAELYRVIKPGGILSISEEFLDPDYLFAFEAIQKAEAAGFVLAQNFGNFWVYTLNFIKSV